MNRRKLGRPTDQRMAMLKGQVSALLWYGKIETTFDRAKEVSRLADKYITLAIKTYDDTVEVTKEKVNLKNEKVAVKFVNDGTKKLAARRKLMAELYDLQEIKGDKALVSIGRRANLQGLGLETIGVETNRAGDFTTDVSLKVFVVSLLNKFPKL